MAIFLREQQVGQLGY
ncbi:hypothetical protein DR871_002450 [Flavobacterium petrolei]|uniref:Uncharacterized protein n=1 Tax=Flavobacterium petrolei TaxID=2259594 RepID=A0A482TQB2_9FLAO|nr:hypothetical protein DR871_002450 [Flavobacterium petrolei]